MSRIRGSDTDPELRLRRRLWGDGLRYRVNYRTPAGRSDLAFPGARVAVYVDGCFWHGCPDHYVRPRSSGEFWSRKLRQNVTRDRRQTIALEESGWTVCRFWEHEIHQDLDGVVCAVKNVLKGAQCDLTQPRWRVVEVVPLNAAGDEERRTMEALRDAQNKSVVHRSRSTKKW